VRDSALFGAGDLKKPIVLELSKRLGSQRGGDVKQIHDWTLRTPRSIPET